MVDCCELALYNSKLALYIALGAFALIALLLTMVFGYNLRWRKQQIELIKRTEQLEKKNGKEQKQINELQAKITQLEKSRA